MCNALVVSGGGSRCSHSVGAAYYIASYEADRFISGFQLMSGVSGGALNVAGWAQHPPEDFLLGAKEVLKIWTDRIQGDRSVFRFKVPVPGFHWIPAVFADSIASGKPLEQLLRSFINPERLRSSGIRVRWPALNLRTSKLEVFDETAEDPVAAVMASSSFPSVFPLVRIGADFYSDGGLVDTNPLRDMIHMGADRICVLTTKIPGVRENPFPANVFKRLRLEISAQIDHLLFEDVRKCHRINEEISSNLRDPLRYRPVDLDLIIPSRPLGDSLKFDPDIIRRQIDLGYEDALRYFSLRKLHL